MKTRKFTALLLVLCLLLTATPYSAPVRAVEEEHLAQEQTQTETQIETETAVEEAAPAPLAEGIFFRFVDQAVFQSNGHVARVPEEETLSTYVFRNSDGTKTVYYLPDNVKYVAEDGTMVDKDLTLVSQAGGYGVKRSDIQYLLPTSAASGIRMAHGSRQVTMYPQAPLGRATAATVSGDSVRYDNYFGSGIHLVYTPIPSGLKEDIILDSYTGTSSFSFTIDTNGMRLYNDEGQYYFATSADAEEKIFLGDIIVYDAKGEPSAGTLTVTPVAMGQQYTLTVSADPAFLTDPDTVYPVTIDPTLESRAESNTNFIEDATIYQNKPTTNAGTWTYNHCGYYASANTDYGVCRTAIRLAGLKNNSTWQSMSYSNIVSAKFYIKEATGTAGVRFTLHNITNTTWTEANATWNSLANAYSTTVSGEASPAYGGWAEFNFTTLAKDWKNSLVTADCSFMLISSNTTVDKAFYSAEFGTTSYRPYVVITYNANTNGLNYTTKSVDEGSSFQLNWPGVTTPITWTSSNTAIATVSSTGLVTGINAGVATITASSEGHVPKTCSVYVTIADGIYRIKNVLSQYYLGVVSSGVTDGSTLRQEAKLSTEPEQFAQMWFVKHLSGTNYSIRPVHKPSKGLSVTSSIVNIRPIGNADTYDSVPTSGRWNISFSLNGYVIKNEGSALAPNNLSSAVNAAITLSTQTMSSAYRWTFEPIDDITAQLALYDVRTHAYSDSIVRYIAPGETLTLAELGIDATYITSRYTTQPLVWDSEDPDYVSINTVTGTVTGISPNQSTVITVTRNTSEARYTQSYSIHVTAIQEGSYYIKSKSSGKYVDIKDQTMANGTVIHQWEFHSGPTQQWIFTHLGDGTYSIKSANSTTAYCLGVKDDSTANDQPVVLRTGASTSGMKWKIAIASSGAYKLTPLTGEANNRVLALDVGFLGNANANGDTLQQRNYVADTNYKDEWYLLMQGGDVLLTGIQDEGHDHISALAAIMPDIQALGYHSYTVNNTSYLSSDDLADQMQQCRLYVSRSHGNFDTEGTYIVTATNATQWIHSRDIYNFETSTPIIDLSDCDLMLFIGCYTASMSGVSITDAAVAAGADVAIGFTKSITCDGANEFTEAFFNYYQANTVSEAARLASDDCGYSSSIYSYRISVNTEQGGN